MIKLKWMVDPPPEGRYRAFARRGWPTADYKGTDFVAAMLTCQDEYRPSDVKIGNHRPISVYIADYSAEGNGFIWRRLKATAATLPEAKALAFTAVNVHTEFHPSW